MRHQAKRPPASVTTRHQIDELFIGSCDFSVAFDVHWTLDEDGDGKPLGYQIDDIALRTVRHFDGKQCVAIEPSGPLRDAIDEAIREQEQRYGTLTDEAARQSEPEDIGEPDDDPDAIGGPGYGGNFYPGE